MEFQDRILNCVDCGTEFIWTAGEQQFFADKNFKNEPKRCKACKGKRAARPAGARARARTGGNRDHVLGLRQGNDGAVQADAGASGVLQGMLPVPEVRRGRRHLTLHRSRRHQSAPEFTHDPSRALAAAATLAALTRAGCAKLTHANLSGAFSMQIEERAVGDVVVLDLKGQDHAWARATSCSRTRSTASSTRVTRKSC